MLNTAGVANPLTCPMLDFARDAAQPSAEARTKVGAQ